ncbi:MAG TPA: hypothetical protein EYN66_13925, partial [Myxococcales bacterium]|nr:hypothetical protein [Myxococcales bacterium]
MVIHFVTPDHQGHAYGTKSDKYRAHILGFDGKLKKLLEALPKDTTVFVTSDHGATDGGRHGSDLPIERRCPIYAYGPGLNAPLPSTGRTLHQIDLASTFATLLGVASPAQSRGHLITSWLKMAPKEKAAAACHDLQRLARYAGAELGRTIPVNTTACDRSAPPTKSLRAALQQAGELDALIASSNTRESEYGFLAPVAAILGALLLGMLLLTGFTSNRELARLALLVTAMVVGQAFWNWQMERFSDAMHVGLYIAITAVADLALVYAFFRSRRTADWVDKHLILAALLFPGILIVSYTRTT